jgi:multicomponent Na+:H+ antiporter subunit G
MTDIAIMVLSTIGALFILIASIGIVKMPDFYSRLSVTIKAATLGIGCILIAAALFFAEFQVTTKVLAIIFFVFITSPVSGYLIGKVGYINGTKLWKHSIIDEMKRDPDSFCTAVHEQELQESKEKKSETKQ